MLDYKQSPQTACDAPRWRFNAGMEINVEHQMNPAVVRELAFLHHGRAWIDDANPAAGGTRVVIELPA